LVARFGVFALFNRVFFVSAAIAAYVVESASRFDGLIPLT